jgi:hypothetical protein
MRSDLNIATISIAHDFLLPMTANCPFPQDRNGTQ